LAVACGWACGCGCGSGSSVAGPVAVAVAGPVAVAPWLGLWLWLGQGLWLWLWPRPRPQGPRRPTVNPPHHSPMPQKSKKKQYFRYIRKAGGEPCGRPGRLARVPEIAPCPKACISTRKKRCWGINSIIARPLLGSRRPPRLPERPRPGTRPPPAGPPFRILNFAQKTRKLNTF